MKLAFSLAFREFRQLKSLLLLMVINLSWGLTGYLTLSTLQTSMKGVLQGNAKKLLSADVAVSARRAMTPEEQAEVRAVISPAIIETQTLELFSMVAAGNDSRLVQVKAVDTQYPLYGELHLEKGGTIGSGASKEIDREMVAWVYPEILVQLNLKIGDNLELGGRKFRISDVIKEDDTQALRIAGLAPKVYIGLDNLKKTSLIQFGTTMTQTMLFKTGPNVKELKDRFLNQIKEPAITASTYIEAGEDTGRFLGYIFDYLGLGALVGVSLAAFGMAALVRSWLGQKVRHYAIYNTLGLQPFDVQKIFMIQLTVMSILTAIVSLALVSIGLPAVAYSIRDWVPVDFNTQLQSGTILKGFLLIWIGSMAVAFPSMLQLKRLPTQQLFGDSVAMETGYRWQSILLWTPILVGFWILSVREVSSFRLGSYFVFAVIASYIVLSLIGWIFFRGLGVVRGKWWARHGILYLARKPALLSTFLALSIGSLLATLIPQIRAGLLAELSGAETQKRPSLFMFDIQDDQMSDFKKVLAENGETALNLSPLIRSRILEVNGKPYERKDLESGFQTREEQDNARMRNRGVNLSYREKLSDSEKIIKGQPFSENPTPGAPFELSVEKRYADRMELQIGDLMKFDVQGVEIEGKIINIREIKWNRFQPNFFILVQNGALAEAPKTWLGNLEKMDEARKSKVQTDLARKFPNISAVDVDRVIEKALEIIAKMTVALQLMALLTWVSGLLVLLALLYRQLSMQKWDANLFRLLGTDRQHLFRIFQTQFTVLVISSVGFGSLLALVVSNVMSIQLFDGIFAVDGVALATTVGLLSAVSIALTSFFSFYLSRLNPAGVLQEVRL